MPPLSHGGGSAGPGGRRGRPTHPWEAAPAPGCGSCCPSPGQRRVGSGRQCQGWPPPLVRGGRADYPSRLCPCLPTPAAPPYTHTHSTHTAHTPPSRPGGGSARRPGQAAPRREGGEARAPEQPPAGGGGGARGRGREDRTRWGEQPGTAGPSQPRPGQRRRGGQGHPKPRALPRLSREGW